MNGLLPLADVARRLKLTYGATHDAACRGDLDVCKVGARLMVTADSVRRFEVRRERQRANVSPGSPELPPAA